MSKRIAAAAARKDFANLLRSCAKGERVKLTRYNKTLVAIIPKGDLKVLEDCESTRHRASRRR